MAKLNSESALSIAKELTITALEHSMIGISHSSEATAEEVGTFYKALVKSLLAEEN